MSRRRWSRSSQPGPVCCVARLYRPGEQWHRADRGGDRQEQVRVRAAAELLPKQATSQKAVERAQAVYDVSLEELKIAQGAQLQARANLQKAQAALAEAQARLGAVGESNPQLRLAVASLGQAELNLEFTTVRAPADGYVTHLQLRIGSHAVANQPRSRWSTLPPTGWTPFSRRTASRTSVPATAAVVTLMTYPDRPLKGVVDSLGWGISKQDGSTGADLLPKVSATFEWIRLAQRIPVRIHLLTCRRTSTCGWARRVRCPSRRGAPMAGRTGALGSRGEAAHVRHATDSSSCALVVGCLSSGCAMVGPDYRPPPAPVANTWLEFEDPLLAASSPVVPLLVEASLSRPGARSSDQRGPGREPDAPLGGPARRAGAPAAPDREGPAPAAGAVPRGQRRRLGSGSQRQLSAAFGTSFTLSWEIDVWGRIRRQIESASAAYDATLSSYDGVTVLLIGQVAETYLLIRTTEQRLTVARRNLAYQAESVRISEAKLEAGRSARSTSSRAGRSSTTPGRRSRSWISR